MLPANDTPPPAPDALPLGVTRHVPSAEGSPAAALDPEALADAIRRAARDLGFVAVGFTGAEPFPEDAARLTAWLAAGHHGDLDYLTEDRTTPATLLAGARTIVAVALPHARDAVPVERLMTQVARYAVGRDYHVVLKERLRELADRVAELAGRALLARACVDTAPLAEHATAARAGIGFTGLNTLTIVPGHGSYVVLGELVLDLALPPDRPAAPRCGTCTRCLDACPTGAFVGPYVLDARRCISYLTIELRGVIPRELRPLIGTRIFGCDVCQEVCPYNRTRGTTDPALRPRPKLGPLDLVTLLGLGSKAHRRLVRGTALERISRNCLARNAAVALGNAAEPAALAPLTAALGGHVSPLVRGHAAWAVGRLVPCAPPGEGARGAALSALRGAATTDADPFVREEAAAALASLPGALEPA